MSEEDPYQKMIVDENEPKEEIRKVISNYIKFSKDGETIHREGFDDLTCAQKIIVQVLSSKAKTSLGFKDEEGYELSELVDLFDYERSTIKGRVYGDLGDIVKSDEGNLHVPNYKVHKALKEITGKEGEHDE